MKEEKGRLNNLNQSLPVYEPPTMITYSEEELLEEMETMSVQACTSFTSAISC
ncbi:MAG: hypothetical protein AB1847_18910 [bacterium]